MENLHVKALKVRGFGIIEVIIAMAVVAVLGTIGYTSYQDHLVKGTENAVVQEMTGLMTSYEKYYSQKGSYTQTNGQPPETIQQAILDNNSKLDHVHYKYFVHPLNATSTSQIACITAMPNGSGGISSKLKIITVDNFGHVTVGGVIPAYCGGDEASIAPEPDSIPDSEPTISPTPTPTPTPSPTDDPFGPKPVNQCVDENGKMLGIPPLTACSGNCHHGKYWACSGNCEYSALCGTGCSGNCENTFIYKGACSGNCDASTIWVSDPQEFFPICNGNCKGVTVVLPKAWTTRTDIIEKCSKKTGKNQKCLCDTGTGNENACEGFKVQYY